MASTASDILIDRLHDYGVDVIFGLPGDGINGIMESLCQRSEKIRFIQVRHEEAAAFMACGYAKFTGRLGVCLATSGPGGIHLLNGLYDAKLDGQSVVALTGLHYRDLLNTHSQQDVELDKLFMDVCVYNARAMGPEYIENISDLACRTALAYRGVAHVTISTDVQSMSATKLRSPRNIQDRHSQAFARGALVPDKRNLRYAAEVLNTGKRIVILAGQGALGATE
jgi:pyruvate dehydrogenase (quinone)